MLTLQAAYLYLHLALFFISRKTPDIGDPASNQMFYVSVSLAPHSNPCTNLLCFDLLWDGMHENAAVQKT